MLILQARFTMLFWQTQTKSEKIQFNYFSLKNARVDILTELCVITL